MKKQTKLGLVLAAAAVISVSVASLVSARGWVQNGADWYYVDNNNEYVTDTIQSSGNSKFYLGEDGRMERDYFLEDYNENTYYFGQNGAMVTNTWVAIESSRVENQEDYIPDNYWYYFQASGKAMKGSSSKCKKTVIDGKKYAFNQYGQMCTGWFDEVGLVVNPDDTENPFTSAIYYAGGDNDGVLRTGWVTYYDGYDGDDDNPASEYTNLYFYFNTSNNKKYGEDGAVTKKINGRTYAFNSDGVMLSGWDPYKERDQYTSISDKTTYFSGEDDGHQVKKGWVYAVPAESIDSKKYNDDEEVYMYFASSGDSVRDQFKKINGKYYAFNASGVMKTGIVIWAPAGVTDVVTGAGTADEKHSNPNGYHYVDKLDLDYAEAANITKKGILQTDSTKYIKVNPNGEVIAVRNTGVANNDYNPGQLRTALDAGNTIANNRPETVKLHYFGEDGARRTGNNNIEFADDTFTFNSNSSGDKGTGTFAKKYYVLGIQAKASSDIRYGMYTLATWNEIPNAGPMAPQSTDGKSMANFYSNIVNNHYEVLTTGGARQKGNWAGKKDADGNYWLIEKSTNALRGIWTVNVHQAKTTPRQWHTRTVRNTAGIAHQKSTCSYADLVASELAVEDPAVGNTGIESATWTAYHTFDSRGNDTGNIYFSLNEATTTECFQSDYIDGSNKWIPMGLLDNANKTTTLNLVDCTDARAHKYEVTPNNDYFLNCFWFINANDPYYTVER